MKTQYKHKWISKITCTKGSSCRSYPCPYNYCLVNQRPSLSFRSTESTILTLYPEGNHRWALSHRVESHTAGQLRRPKHMRGVREHGKIWSEKYLGARTSCLRGTVGRPAGIQGLATEEVAYLWWSPIGTGLGESQFQIHSQICHVLIPNAFIQQYWHIYFA